MSTETTLGEFEKKITLPEYRTKSYAPDDIPDGLGEYILENYESEVETEPPSIKTSGNWEFTNQGYAGRLTTPDDWSIQLEPKVDLQNIFGMMEYAYDLDSARFLEGAYDAGSIQEFFDKVVSILAENVIKRSNQGFHKEYIKQEEESQFVRGKIDIQKTAQKPWKPEAHTKYRELTANIEDNQILLWTLFRTLSSESLSEGTLNKVRRGVRELQNIAELEEYTANDCVGREYQRLNSDYEFMHSLCRLILDNSGPTRETGEYEMIPFLVEMPTLYERFVARWFKQNIPAEYRVEPQKSVTLDERTGLSFDIDIVVYKDDEVVAVADTKYKIPSNPSTDDVSQIISYAERMDTENAFLVYPQSLSAEFDFTVGDIRIRDLQFRVDDELERNGRRFRDSILSAI
ncbi:restriction endonuclease [Halobacteriales archaeon SW_8_68_21]|nr:MAG: restriction endonuclease [Halobacteriales archaeon SW_8_68_21]